MNNSKIKSTIFDLFRQPTLVAEKALPTNMQWPELVCQGHIWIARMNYIMKWRNIALLAFIGTLSYDLIINIPVMLYAAGYASNHAATVPERLILSPWISAKQAFSSPAPALDFHGRPIAQTDNLESATAVSELPPVIAANLKSLNVDNKMTLPCDSSWNIQEGWSHDNNFNTPKCKITGGEVWIGSAVSAGEGNEKLLFGVFRKVDGQFKYWNVTLPGNSFPVYPIPGYPTVSSESVPRSVSKAFPELVKGAN